MAEAKFEKLSHSKNKMYGPRKFLFCGFSVDTQPKLMLLLKIAGLSDVPSVWATVEDSEKKLADLLEQPDQTGWGNDSKLPRTIIVSGITENELQRFMSMSKKTG